ncbi:hypothetical protein [Streptomyces mesophilus]|uniref:hypothetical protein n=1 Tax=Streptomyces mesophilus TaxID=1775132 RepID=UPI00332308ED
MLPAAVEACTEAVRWAQPTSGDAVKPWRVLLALPALVIAGCGFGPGSGGRPCTLIGGDSGVTVQFDAADFTGQVRDAGAPILLRLCADGFCKEGSITKRDGGAMARVFAQLDENIGEATVPVRFTISSGGRELYDEQAEVKLRKSQPNGAGCSPTLYQGGLTAHPERGLLKS